MRYLVHADQHRRPVEFAFQTAAEAVSKAWSLMGSGATDLYILDKHAYEAWPQAAKAASALSGLSLMRYTVCRLRRVLIRAMPTSGHVGVPSTVRASKAGASRSAGGEMGGPARLGGLVMAGGVLRRPGHTEVTYVTSQPNARCRPFQSERDGWFLQSQNMSGATMRGHAYQGEVYVATKYRPPDLRRV
jgi:hypothetical protein